MCAKVLNIFEAVPVFQLLLSESIKLSRQKTKKGGSFMHWELDSLDTELPGRQLFGFQELEEKPVSRHFTHYL